MIDVRNCLVSPVKLAVVFGAAEPLASVAAVRMRAPHLQDTIHFPVGYTIKMCT
jgi:hypothetical protein